MHHPPTYRLIPLSLSLLDLLLFSSLLWVPFSYLLPLDPAICTRVPSTATSSPLFCISILGPRPHWLELDSSRLFPVLPPILRPQTTLPTAPTDPSTADVMASPVADEADIPGPNPSELIPKKPPPTDSNGHPSGKESFGLTMQIIRGTAVILYFTIGFVVYAYQQLPCPSILPDPT